jgi:hypothetical protein
LPTWPLIPAFSRELSWCDRHSPFVISPAHFDDTIARRDVATAVILTRIPQIAGYNIQVIENAGAG